MMEIGLKSGKVIECDDESYIISNDRTGEVVRIFKSAAHERMYTVRDEDIEYMNERLVPGHFDGYDTPQDDDEVDSAYEFYG